MHLFVVALFYLAWLHVPPILHSFNNIQIGFLGVCPLTSIYVDTILQLFFIYHQQQHTSKGIHSFAK